MSISFEVKMTTQLQFKLRSLLQKFARVIIQSVVTAGKLIIA